MARRKRPIVDLVDVESLLAQVAQARREPSCSAQVDAKLARISDILEAHWERLNPSP